MDNLPRRGLPSSMPVLWCCRWLQLMPTGTGPIGAEAVAAGDAFLAVQRLPA